VAGVALTAALVSAGSPVAASGVESVGGDVVNASTRLQVTGTILVLSGRDSAPGERTARPLPDEVRLVTRSGESVQVTGSLPDEMASGTSFKGTLSIPEEYVPEINSALHPEDQVIPVDQGASEVIDGASPLGEVILAATETSDAALQIEDSTVQVEAAEVSRAATAHAFDVAVLSLPSDPEASVVSDADVTALVQDLSSYWASQSAGAVASVTMPQKPKRLSSSAACDPRAAWDAAAEAFGHVDYNWYWSHSPAQHLVVLAPPACGAGSGLGSVGSPTAGGLIWAGYNSIIGPQTVAHEFGHNVGLRHSNVHGCSGTISEGSPSGDGTFSDGCVDGEYQDYFDIMGGGLTVCRPACASNGTLMALNVTHKHVLGSLNGADLRPVVIPDGVSTNSQTFTLNPASASTGLRGLEVTDPRSGEHYFVEYRSGTGIDSDSLYADGSVQDLAPGVRVLRLRDSLSSAVLTAPGPSGTSRPLSLSPGRSFTGHSGGLTVTVTAATSTEAKVTVELARQRDVTRLWGADRYETAVKVSQAGYPANAGVVYVAAGTNYPDALAAAPAAVKQGGPLLLTATDSLPAVVSAEITRLKPAQIVVVGGINAVSENVKEQLAAIQPQTLRVWGEDRYDTARAIVRHAFPAGASTAWIASGRNFPDALSASAAAGKDGFPVVLLDGTGEAVDPATENLLAAMGTTKVLIAGGPAAVSEGVRSVLAKTMETTRLSGADRYATSQAINAHAFPTGSASAHVATGAAFPDALAGATIAGSRKSPLYVVPPTCLPGPLLDTWNTWQTTSVSLIGGPNSLATEVQALRRC
jgi:putative cell wall-binding protein